MSHPSDAIRYIKDAEQSTNSEEIRDYIHMALRELAAWVRSVEAEMLEQDRLIEEGQE